MRSCLRRLLSLSIVLVFAALFCSVGICGRVYAAKPDGSTTSGSGYDNYSSSTTDTEKAGSGKPWKSFGNDDIDETQHFLGTTDDNDIVIKTNNTEKARVTSEGNVGIGTDAPTGTLHVEGGIAEGAVDGTDITIKAQDGGPDGGAGGDIVLKPGTGSGFVTDDDGNPVQATDEDGSPLFEDDGNGNLVPVFIPNSGNVIIDGNLAPSSGHSITLGTPELRYSGIYLASWFKYDTDGLYFYYTADERTPVDYFHARFTVDATPYIGGDGWTYFNVDTERSGNFIISPNQSFESALGTEKLQVDGDVMSTGNVDAVTFSGDGSALSGVVTSEIDPAFTASAASSITSAGSNEVITAAERTSLGTAVQIETDPTVTLAKLEGLVVDFHTLGGVDADTQLNAAGVTALETDPDFNASAASTITDAGSNEVITAAERTSLGTALQTETDPTVTLAKLEGLVVDFHTLGGIDADTQLDAAGVTALETDPEVGTNTLNYLSKWDGSALVTGSIFDNGNVGIGTTSPEGKLTVLGGDIVVREDDNENDAIKLWAGNVEAVISAYKAGIESIRLDSGNGDSWIDNGNVGIGTTSPNFQLSLGAGLSHTKIALYETGATNHYGMGIVAGQFSFHLNGSGARYAFYDSDDLTNELLTIKGSGNVGIGTENPQAKLHIGGTPGVDGIKFPDGTTQTTAASSGSSDPTSFFEVYLGGVQATHGTYTKVNWRIEDSDTNNEFDLNANRFTVKVAGIYMLQAVAAIPSTQTRDSHLQLRKNGAIIADVASTPGWNWQFSTNSISIMVDANVGDYFDVWGYNSSGHTLNMITGKQYTYFKGFRLK